MYIHVNNFSIYYNLIIKDFRWTSIFTVHTFLNFIAVPTLTLEIRCYGFHFSHKDALFLLWEDFDFYVLPVMFFVGILVWRNRLWKRRRRRWLFPLLSSPEVSEWLRLNAQHQSSTMYKALYKSCFTGDCTTFTPHLPHYMRSGAPDICMCILKRCTFWSQALMPLS